MDLNELLFPHQVALIGAGNDDPGVLPAAGSCLGELADGIASLRHVLGVDPWSGPAKLSVRELA